MVWSNLRGVEVKKMDVGRIGIDGRHMICYMNGSALVVTRVDVIIDVFPLTGGKDAVLLTACPMKARKRATKAAPKSPSRR